MFKMKSLYERFQEDYVAVKTPCGNKDGFKIEYAYYSPWFVWDLPEDELKKEKKAILWQGIASLLVYVLTASIPCWLNAAGMVAYPALASMIFLCLELFGIGQFWFAKYRTTRFTYEDVHRRLRVYPLLNLAASSIAAAACVWYMSVWGFSQAGVIVALGYGAEAVLSGRIHSQYRKIPFTTEKNDTLRRVEPVFFK